MIELKYAFGFLYGFTGGFFVEILNMYRIRKVPADLRPPWIRTWFYWICSIAMMLCGGGLVVFYIISPDVQVSPLLGLNIGASAPLIIGALAEKAPDIPPGNIG